MLDLIRTYLLIALISSIHLAGYAQTPSYTSSQVDSIIQQTELIPIRVTGDKNNRINIVIINRWEKRDENPYNKAELRAEFLDDVKSSLLAAFTPGDSAAQTAYANYYQFFNLYALWWPETPEWGKGVDTDLIEAIRDKLFLPWKDEYTGWVTFLNMPNRDGGGGGAARNLEARVGNSVIAGKGIGKMLHEISHTCTSIGDEYTAGATGTSAIPTYTSSLEYEREKIKWKAWIDDDTPLPTPYRREYLNKVGAFEGTQYHLTNYFRPSAQGCIMGAGVFDNTEEMCVVCEQRLSMRVYTLVDPIENVFPSAGKLQIKKAVDQYFSVSRIHPVPDTQLIQWFLNGNQIASGVDEIRVPIDPREEYELVYTLRDTTSFIREDPPFGEFPYRERRWLINVDSDQWIPHYTFSRSENTEVPEKGIRYEAEKAEFDAGINKIVRYPGASELSMVAFEAGGLTWKIQADQKGTYALDVIYASTEAGITKHLLWVNDKLIAGPVFPTTRPQFTGWEKVTVNTLLEKGENSVRLESEKGQGITVDFLWVPSNQLPIQQENTIARFDYEGEIALRRHKNGGVKVIKPRKGFVYEWYIRDVPIFRQEEAERPLMTGVFFNPDKSGNYYVGTRQVSNGAESSTRRGFFYNMESPSKIKSIEPDEALTSKLLIWLDASDMNGDGLVDKPSPPRDPYKDWRDKASGLKGPFVLYKPNQLNGMGVTGFEMVWVTNLEKPVKNYQTVIMVYKESDMSFPGTSPFRGMDKYIGKSAGSQIFTEDVSDMTKNSAVYLNGELIDPLTHENPMEYCILTIVFPEKVTEEFKTTQGLWEGSLAELIVYEGALSEDERKAVEGGLRKKWFSTN